MRRAVTALFVTFCGLILLLQYKTIAIPPPRRLAAAPASTVPRPAAAGAPPPVATRPTASVAAAPPATSASPPPSQITAPVAATAPPRRAPATTAPTTTTTSPPPPRQYTGTAVPTQYGNVQVQITISGSTITDVQALQLPSDYSRSRQISDYAGPQLRQEALDAQSAQIDTVSGATYTSDGYRQSLQSALDQAGR